MSVCGWGAGDKGGCRVPPPEAAQSTAESLHFPKRLAADWKQSKVAPLLGKKKPHSQKVKERVPQGHLLPQCLICSPCSGLSHDAAYSPVQAPFPLRLLAKHSPRALPGPQLLAAGGQLHTASQELKKTKTSLKFKRGKRLVWYAKYGAQLQI